MPYFLTALAYVGSILPLLLTPVIAAASINVSLKTSFNAAPYIVELLETAALENCTSYFPLLDRIADGTFTDLTTEQELYNKFLDVLLEDGHVRNAEALSSFKFALSLHAAAPRIEAHYQYYNTSIRLGGMMAAQDAACPVWVYLDGKQYCSPSLERAQQDIYMDESHLELPFDRILGSGEVPTVLYADISHPLFGQFHETVSKTARDGQTTYRLRYRPPQHGHDAPVFLNGYGVELVLKRTDYIVIDDRDQTSSEKVQTEQIHLDDNVTDEETELIPLTTSELFNLGLNTASYITSNDDPLETLLRVSGNFPRFSSAIASRNATIDFLKEHYSNRQAFLPAGYNALWINGLRLESRQINAFSLLDHLRRERTLLGQLQDIGLTATEAIDLLSHEVIAKSQAEDEPQRYDWRDETEGSNVIMWLNDIEQDKRYSTWPSDLGSFLQRTYPGQLPTVRRDVHNLVVSVDLAEMDDLELILDMLLNLVKRTVPVRIGLVPSLNSTASTLNARLAYSVLDTYGLNTFVNFLTKLRASTTPSRAGKSSFEDVQPGATLRDDAVEIEYDTLLESVDYTSRLQSSLAYVDRLQLAGPSKLLLVNGVALARSETWLDAMSQRISADLRSVQRTIYEGMIPEDTWLPQLFLLSAATTRNALVVPEDLKSIKIVDVSGTLKEYGDVFSSLPRISGDHSGLLSERAHLLIIVDLDIETGRDIVKEALAARVMRPEAEIVIIHNPKKSQSISSLALKLYQIVQSGNPEIQDISIFDGVAATISGDASKAASAFWHTKHPVVEKLGFLPGENALWLNGRLVGPVTTSFSSLDFETLFSFEKSQRITAVTTAITALGLEERFESALDLAKVTSLVALSTTSDIPDDIYGAAPPVRESRFKVWNGTHTSIHAGKAKDPAIRIVASIDPAADTVQHWIPILKTLSELEGVDLLIYLNPKERLTELPIKRFYRQVIQSSPTFDGNGKLSQPRAVFSGVPKDALLNLGMVVPPAWLVAPKESIHDLDNIKLSSVPGGQDIDAIYELEHILIEGHSRDVTKGSPPRGAQLLLGTENEPHFTDTLVMANLGYFQFKANPGYWQISLTPGRSSKIFNIDSSGAKGYSAQVGDETTSVALMSFQGLTLFPRLSRKPGMESEDVLETGLSTKSNTAMNYLNKGASFASSALSSWGLPNLNSLTTMSSSSSTIHADINIFSVASGHLYERMLNIMMLSVLRHTNHTVKFWFIEQFLSPSFKSFLPHLAAHYNFQYALITYKWPHWLRSQSEKQREIWGYKILFLDVLFPLSLTKVIFVDADQIVRTDLMTLNEVDLHSAPYAFTPMCSSRTEMDGFRFWTQGYWADFLQGKPYHISALYVVDLLRFRALAAGDRLRQQYHALSADPNSLSNLDQDLPNHMQHVLPIHSLDQSWLWCETWCSDESLSSAKTIDLCNNPLTKEPKLDRARRQIPEWNGYDEEIEGVRQAWLRGREVQGGVNGSQKVQFQERESTPRVKDEL